MRRRKSNRKSGLKIAAISLATVIVIASAYILLFGNAKREPGINYGMYSGDSFTAVYPDANFAVISDVHFYDTSLGTEGAAFQEVLRSDRKLLVESEELLDLAIDEILTSGVQFVLISGDLTKDGEKINHARISQKLMRLVDYGVGVYVVPGNHDVNNFNAEKYVGDEKQRIESVTPDEFGEYYARMGYGSALMRDSGTLSYVAEPVDGLWILAVDSCRYEENVEGGDHAVIAGSISEAHAQWIADVLSEAVSKEKAVIVLTHHGVVEHWNGQAKLHPDYLVQDYVKVSEFLSSYGVKLAFTGHYHAQSIAKAEYSGKALYDIETGSLVTGACHIRYCTIKDNMLSVSSDMLAHKLRPGTDFAENAEKFVKETVILEAVETLKKYKVSEKDSDYIGNAVGDAFVAHYNGDADESVRPDFDSSKLSIWGKIVYSMQKYVLDGLWADLPPEDNNVTIDLR